MDMAMRYLRYALLAGVFSLPFLPFFVANDLFFPFITGKNFLFRITVELLAAGVIILALRDPKYRPRFSWVAIAVLAFTAAAVIATLFSVEPTKSFWSNFERMEGLLGTLHLALWFFIATIMLSTERLWERFLNTSLAASLLMSFYCFFQLAGEFEIHQGGVRLDGTLGNAIYLAVYMLFHIFFALFMALRYTGPRIGYLFYGLVVLFDLIVLYYTATRSATLGLLGGLLVAALGIGLFDRSRPYMKKWAFGVIAAIVVFVGIFFLVKDVTWVKQNPVLGRFATISFEETTVKSRFLIWNMAFQGFADKPIVGWGQENFSYVFNTYYDPRMYAQEQWFDRAHNAFIDWLIAGGILGFLAFVSLFVACAWAILRGEGLTIAERSVLLGLLAAYTFHSLFVFDNLVSSIYFFVLLALVHATTRRALPTSIFMTRPASVPLVYGGAAVAVAGAVCAIYFLNVPGIANARILIEGISMQEEATTAAGEVIAVAKDPAENLEAFREIARRDTPLGRQEAVEQLLQGASVIGRNEQVNPQVREGFITLARERIERMIIDRPDDARLELFYGGFLNQIGQYQEAATHLSRAHDLSPKKQWIYFETAFNTYVATGNYAQAVTLTKEAFELEPAFDEARLFYAAALIFAGEQASAEKLLTERFGTAVIDDQRLFVAYANAKHYDRVVAIAQMRIAADPENADKHVSLGIALKESGNVPAALVAFRKAAQLKPEYRDALARIAQEWGAAL